MTFCFRIFYKLKKEADIYHINKKRLRITRSQSLLTLNLILMKKTLYKDTDSQEISKFQSL